MSMHFVQLEGYTTKGAVRKVVYKGKGEGGRDLVFAYVTLMQKRPYRVVERDSAGNVIYEADGKTPKRTDVSDAITLKFMNSSAESIEKFKPEGIARRLWVLGNLSTYEKEEDTVLVKYPDGTKKAIPVWAMVDGQKVQLKPIQTHTIVEVSEWRFLDSNPNTTTTPKATYVDDGTGAFVEDETTTITTTTDDTSELPAFQPAEFTPKSSDELF